MSPEITTLFDEAEKAEHSGEFDKAIQLYQTILRTSPKEDWAYYAAANAYAIRGLIPQVVEQYLKLANVLEERAYFDGAFEVCQWVISIEPFNIPARSKLIHLLEKTGNPKGAREQSLSLSRVYIGLGQGEQSIQLLEELKKQDPENPEVCIQLGGIYIQHGQIAEGLSLYKETARKLLSKENYARALDVLKRIKAIKLNDLDNLFSLGQVYVQLGRLEEGKSEFRQLLRQNLSYVPALFQLGLIAIRQRQWEEARVPFRKVLELESENKEARVYFGEVNEISGNFEEAVQLYLTAAKLYEQSNQSEQAVTLYQNVLALQPDSTEARNRLEALGAPVDPKKRFLGITESSQVPEETSAEEELPADASSLFSQTLPKKLERKFLSGIAGSGIEASTLAEWEKSRLVSKSIFRSNFQSSSRKTQESSGWLKKRDAVFQGQGKVSGRLSKKLFLRPQEPSLAKKEVVAQTPEQLPPSSEPLAVEESAGVVEEEKEIAALSEASFMEAYHVTQEEFTSAQEEKKELVSHLEEVPVEEAKGEKETEESVVEVKEETGAGKKETIFELEQLMSQGRWGPAITWAKEALNTTPQDKNIKTLLAKAYYQAGLLNESLELFQALSEETGEVEILQKIAEIHLLQNRKEEWAEALTSYLRRAAEKGETEKGIEAASRILAWNPSHAQARGILVSLLKQKTLEPFALYHQRELIEILERSNNLPELILSYRQFLSWKSGDTSIRYKLALCYQEMGRTSEAKSEFLQIVEQYSDEQNYEKAAEILERIFSLEPHDASILERLRDLYFRLGKKQEALELEMQLGDLALQEEKFESALQSYRKVVQEDPFHPPATQKIIEVYIKQRKSEEAVSLGRQLAESYAKNNQFEEAIEVYKNLLARDSENLSLHWGLGVLFGKTGQKKSAIEEYMTVGESALRKALYDEAVEAYQEALLLDGACKEARYQLGVVYADHKHDWGSAIAEFKKVRGLDPNHAAALLRLVRSYVQLNEVETALEYIRELSRPDPDGSRHLEELSRTLEARLEAEPDNQLLRFNLGLIYKEKGKYDEAIREFQIVIRQNGSPLSLRAYAHQGLAWEAKAKEEGDDTFFQTALRVYKKGLETKGHKEEDYLELFYRMGLLSEFLGRIPEALSYYQEIITVNLDYKDAAKRRKLLEEEINSSGKVSRLPSRRQESAK